MLGAARPGADGQDGLFAAVAACLDDLDRSEVYFSDAGYPLGKVYFFKALLADDDDQASDLYLKAIGADSTDVTIVAQAYTNLANASIERNQPDSARYWVNLGLRAVERYQPENHLLRAFLLVNDALLDYQAQNYAKALATLTEVERLCGPSLSQYAMDCTIFCNLSRIL